MDPRSTVLGQVQQGGVGALQIVASLSRWLQVAAVDGSMGPWWPDPPDSPEKLAVWHSSGFKILDPSRCTYLHIPVLSGVSFTYHSQMCKSGVSGLMGSDSSNIF